MQPCPDPPVDPAASSNVGGWWLLALAVALVVGEIFLARSGRPTMTQWLRRHMKGKFRWVLRILGGGVIGVVLWHIFYGGPL